MRRPRNIKSVTKEFKADDDFAGTEKEATDPVAVRVDSSTRQRRFSIHLREIYEYFMGRVGLPKTYDTTSAKAVWNYPVKSERLDLVSEKTVEEDGELYVPNPSIDL